MKNQVLYFSGRQLALLQDMENMETIAAIHVRSTKDEYVFIKDKLTAEDLRSSIIFFQNQALAKKIILKQKMALRMLKFMRTYLTEIPKDVEFFMTAAVNGWYDNPLVTTVQYQNDTLLHINTDLLENSPNIQLTINFSQIL